VSIVYSTHPEFVDGTKNIILKLDWKKKMFQLFSTNNGYQVNFFDILGVRHPGEDLAVRPYEKPQIANLVAHNQTIVE
jgi:hypothetical protein